MNFENTIVQIALLGTNKIHKFPIAEQGSIGSLCSDLMAIEGDAPSKILRIAGSLALVSRCGYLPSVLPVKQGHKKSSQIAAKPDPVIEEILKNGPMRLQAELLDHLNELGQRLPSKFLTLALDMGRSDIAIREKLIPVLGRRGKWLASQNKSWSYASGDFMSEKSELTNQWTHGTLAERLVWFEMERNRDPLAARNLLQNEFSSLPASERVFFIKAMEISLGHEDEEFLNIGLRDRSKDVRFVASCILAKLPESAYSQRMVNRINALLSLHNQWIIEAPDLLTPDATWKEDQIETQKSPQERLGDRAFLLAQLISKIHPAWWIEKLKMSPESLLEWSSKSTWKDAIQQGWMEAVSNHPDADWAVALLAQVSEARRSSYQDRLLAGISLEKMEERWRVIPNKKSEMIRMSQEILTICPAGKNLSDAFSMKLSDRICSILKNEENAYWFQNISIYQLGLVMSLDSVIQITQVDAKDGWVKNMVDHLQTLVQKRKALQDFVSTSI